MTYSELLQKVLLGTTCCNGEDLTTCYDCPYSSYRQKVDSGWLCIACQRALSHDKNILINIMKYLDKIQEEVTDND